MNVKSKYDEGDSLTEPKKKSLWLGFVDSSQELGHVRGRIMFGIWDTHAVDPILEVLGVKKRTRKSPKGEE